MLVHIPALVAYQSLPSIGLSLILLIAPVYFLPTAIAVARKSTSAPLMAVLNTIFGITLIGWFIIFGYALSLPRYYRVPPKFWLLYFGLPWGIALLMMYGGK